MNVTNKLTIQLDQLLAPSTVKRIRTDPRINIELPEEMKARLVDFANARGVTVSKVLRAMLELHLYPEISVHGQ